MAEFFQYLPLALTFTNLLTLILGVIGRLILGATPGLSPTMVVALLVPFTFHMDPTTGLILLGSVYTATVAGGADPLGEENVFILCSGPLNGNPGARQRSRRYRDQITPERVLYGQLCRW